MITIKSKKTTEEIFVYKKFSVPLRQLCLSTNRNVQSEVSLMCQIIILGSLTLSFILNNRLHSSKQTEKKKKINNN